MRRTLIITVLLLSACVSTPTGEVATSRDAVTIGILAPLTGPFAEWGASIEHGARTTIEEHGLPMRVEVRDTGCQPRKTVTAGRQLIAQNVSLMIGPGCMTGLQALAPVAENALLFSTGFLTTDLVNNHSNVINWATQVRVEAESMAAYLKSQGKERVGVIHGTNAFGEAFGNALPDSLRRKGITATSVESVPLNTDDFRTTVARIMRHNPDAVVVHQGEQNVVQFVQQLRSAEYDVPVYSYYAIETPTVFNAGDAVGGLRSTYPYTEDSLAKDSFDTRYEQIHGTSPTVTSYFVHDGLLILNQAIEACGEEVACIRTYFRNRTANGLSGTVRFTDTGAIERRFGVKQIENGTSRWVRDG